MVQPGFNSLRKHDVLKRRRALLLAKVLLAPGVSPDEYEAPAHILAGGRDGTGGKRPHIALFAPAEDTP